MSKKTFFLQNPKLPSWGVRMQDFKGENFLTETNRIKEIWQLLIGTNSEITMQGLNFSVKDLFEPMYLLPFILFFCKQMERNSVSFALKVNGNCPLGVEVVDVEITDVEALAKALKAFAHKNKDFQLDSILDEMALWLSRDSLDTQSIECFGVNIAINQDAYELYDSCESVTHDNILEDEEYYTSKRNESDPILATDQVDQAFSQAIRELIVNMSGSVLSSPGSLIFLDGLKDFPEMFKPDLKQNSDWTKVEKESYAIKTVDINSLRTVTQNKFISDIREMLCKGTIVLVRGLPPDPDKFKDIPSTVIKIWDIMPEFKRAVQLLREQGFKFKVGKEGLAEKETVEFEVWLDSNRFFHLDPNQTDSVRHWLRLQIKADGKYLTDTSLVHLKTIFNLQQPMKVSVEDAKVISDMSENDFADLLENFANIEDIHQSFNNINTQPIINQQLAGVAIIGNPATEEQGHWNYTLDGREFRGVPKSVSETNALVLSSGVMLRFVAADNYQGPAPALQCKIIFTGDKDVVDGLISAEELLNNKQALSCINVTGFKVAEINITSKNSSLDENFFLETENDSSVVTGPQGKTIKTIKVLDNLGETERGDARRYQSLLQPMPLQGKNDPDWIWKSMQAEFPWMQEANQALAEAAGVCNAAGTDYFRLSKAILLVGKPGIGKTRWARRAAELLELKSGSLSLGGVSTSMSLIGSERGWANGNPSFPARIMHRYNVANPLLFIDEIDKVGESKQNGNPVDAILSMLERESASCFPDNYLQGNLNLKYCSWIFAVNSIAGLGQPLLSRVRVVQTASPRAEHFSILFKGIIEDFCSENELLANKLPDMSNQESRFERSFLENLSARVLQSTVEDWLRAQFWQPPGPKLVVENKL